MIALADLADMSSVAFAIATLVFVVIAVADGFAVARNILERLAALAFAFLALVVVPTSAVTSSAASTSRVSASASSSVFKVFSFFVEPFPPSPMPDSCSNGDTNQAEKEGGAPDLPQNSQLLWSVCFYDFLHLVHNVVEGVLGNVVN